ncbi:MAG: 2,5-diamino-6-(ribosylamino)-4(3H)-pyrimidinone 5'-phosphate reductase [Promethearchaeota archaeon]
MNLHAHIKNPPQGRPWVLYNAAMSIDGKIATVGGDTHFSDTIDWQEVHNIRSQVDAIMVGSGTVIADDPRLTIQTKNLLISKPSSKPTSKPISKPTSKPISKPTTNPMRIVVDSRLQTPLDARVIDFEADQYSTLILTTTQADQDRIKDFKAKGVEIEVYSGANRVPLVEAMQKLYERGIHKILFEGGGTLAWSMLETGLIDELRLLIAPHLVGGSKATGLVMGDGFSKVELSSRFTLTKIHSRDSYVILQYTKA